MLVLAGNTPAYTVDHMVSILKKLQADGIKVALDTDAQLVKKMLSTKLFLLKTTKEEVRALVSYFVETTKDMVRAAKDLHAQGVENVMILDIDGNAVLASKEGTFQCDVLDPTTIVNTVGTGDSLVAGFLMEYNRSRNIVDSFRFGASCGSATAYSKGMATREKIESFSNSVEVRKID